MKNMTSSCSMNELTSLEQRIKNEIVNIFTSFDFEKQRKSYFNILDTDEDRNNRQKLLKQKQIDMIQGLLWQKIFGCVDGMTDLGIGHWSGLDLHCSHKKQYFEIKNSYRSDNSSSRSTKEQLLCRIKKQYPDHMCIYGIVNGTTRHTIKKVDGVDIHVVSGDELFRLVFGKDWQEIVRFVQLTYQQCRNQIAS